jgi:hypothetical protein
MGPKQKSYIVSEHLDLVWLRNMTYSDSRNILQRACCTHEVQFEGSNSQDQVEEQCSRARATRRTGQFGRICVLVSIAQ